MEIGGKSYGQYRGMGSMAAMKAGSAARYGHTSDGTRKVAPEGVEALKEVSGSVDRVHSQLIGGLGEGVGSPLEQLCDCFEFAFAQAHPLGSMARALRIQHPGAIHDVMNRGDRREGIFLQYAVNPILTRYRV